MRILNPKSVLLICIAICLFVTTNIHWNKNKWQNIIEADAKGYYAYLPATFIYHDLNFGFYDSIEKKKYYNEFLVYDYRSSAPNGSIIDKYYCGTALAQTPFFLIAHTLTLLSGNDADGYSRIYMLCLTIAALFYLWIGCHYLNKLLEMYQVTAPYRSFIIPVIIFGTNLFFYSVCEMGMSHVYSFAFISMFCYYSKLFFEQKNSKYFLIACVLLGFVFLIRPVNGMVVLALPYLAGSWLNFKNTILELFKSIKSIVLGIALFFILIGIQAIIYKVSTNQWWVYSYGDEKFDFMHPHFLDILFSYKKGLFVYTPIYLVSLLGLYAVGKQNKYEILSFFLFFIVCTYILSSWWNWWYGGSFSSRVYVEYIPFFAIMLGKLLLLLKTKIQKLISISIIVLLVGLCQFQTYQYRYYIIHWENMTQEKYWNVFLSLKK